ncbi:ACR, yggU family protein [Hirsutella rhossiliensis]|uniref:ACR, yggU family protein n=1 Tax=Hirsutella rhossiliensis TaxID=111463 RepID=A0A9P8SCU9_9HYPO|nr:ACR, yggU family protein [Hirsutella rhossiliensis]KAH0958023.1 ACR, yggU family protein [Hirsutella rhossiliensis]
MASGSAVRFVFGSKQSPGSGALCLRLRVKPGTSKDREGVSSVLDDCVELCVAAQARDGEANKAVVRLLSDVVGLPKSRFRLTHGTKSRDKTVMLGGVTAGEGPALANTVLGLLRRASG